MELRDFIKTFVRKSAEQPGNLRDYVHDFTTYSAKAVAIKNLTKQEWGQWFMRGLPIEYYRHVIEKTGAVADEPSIFVFERLRQTVLSQMTAIESAERMTILPYENI